MSQQLPERPAVLSAKCSCVTCAAGAAGSARQVTATDLRMPACHAHSFKIDFGVCARARACVCVATCLGVVVVTDCVCASVCARQHGVWSHVVTRHARVCLRGVFH